MNEQPPTSADPPKHYFAIFGSVAVALIVVAVAWLAYKVETLPTQPAQPTKSEEKTPVDTTDTGWNTTVKSGKGGFEVTFPDGWGPLTNVKNSDWIIYYGQGQPDLAKGKKVEVTEADGAGGDSFHLFSIVLLDKGGAAAPRGETSEFSFGKGEEEVKGTKYTYIYPKDDLVGIGYQRFQGDRDYEYVFEVNGKELHVYYSVAGSDPRNLSETVDEIVRTIRL